MKKKISMVLLGASLMMGLVGCGQQEDRVVINDNCTYQVVAYGNDVYIESDSIYGRTKIQLTNRETGDPITYDEYISTHSYLLD